MIIGQLKNWLDDDTIGGVNASVYYWEDTFHKNIHPYHMGRVYFYNQLDQGASFFDWAIIAGELIFMQDFYAWERDYETVEQICNTDKVWTNEDMAVLFPFAESSIKKYFWGAFILDVENQMDNEGE